MHAFFRNLTLEGLKRVLGKNAVQKMDSRGSKKSMRQNAGQKKALEDLRDYYIPVIMTVEPSIDRTE